MKLETRVAILRANKQLRQLITALPRRQMALLVVVGILTLVGIRMLSNSHAASSSVALEPENGTVSSPATVKNDSSASGGSAIAFGTAPTPPPPAPTPTPPASGYKLTWAPPAGYQNYPVKNITTSGYTSLDAGGGDMYIKLPSSGSVGPIGIKNCRNAVIIGGSIRALPTATVSGSDQRAIFVYHCTGIVHIEGVYIEAAVAGSQTDGIAAESPGATLQIENVRVHGIQGALSGNHGDVFQPWGGLAEYRIDHLTGSSNYQGLKVVNGLSHIGKGTIKYANIFSSEVYPVDGGGHYLWVDCPEYPLTLSNVYINPRKGRTLGNSIYPTDHDATCPNNYTAASGQASWPAKSNVTGIIKAGFPPGGDYVPDGVAGAGYKSPGYL